VNGKSEDAFKGPHAELLKLVNDEKNENDFIFYKGKFTGRFLKNT
jgi:hypothetical protein